MNKCQKNSKNNHLLTIQIFSGRVLHPKPHFSLQLVCHTKYWAIVLGFWCRADHEICMLSHPLGDGHQASHILWVRTALGANQSPPSVIYLNSLPLRARLSWKNGWSFTCHYYKYHMVGWSTTHTVTLTLGLSSFLINVLRVNLGTPFVLVSQQVFWPWVWSSLTTELSFII